MPSLRVCISSEGLYSEYVPLPNTIAFWVRVQKRVNFRRDTTFDQWLRLYGKVARLIFRGKEVFCREGRSSDFSWLDWLIQVWLLTEPLSTPEVMWLWQITCPPGLYACGCREMLIACMLKILTADLSHRALHVEPAVCPCRWGDLAVLAYLLFEF